MSEREQISEDRRKYIINTARLAPWELITRCATYSVGAEGQAIAEYYQRIKPNSVECAIEVSSDGERISVFDSGDRKDNFANPDQIPDSEKRMKLFSITNLPDKYWKLYKRLKDVIDLKRKETPKIIIYSKEVKCSMMENFPNPVFEVVFSEGWSIIKDGSKIFKLQDDKKQTITEKDLDEKSLFWLKEMIKQCQLSHNVLSDLELFPAFFGDEDAFNRAMHYKSGEIKQMGAGTGNAAGIIWFLVWMVILLFVSFFGA